MNVNLIQSLIEQENESKTKEAISFAEPLLSTVGEEERFDLMEAMAKWVPNQANVLIFCVNNPDFNTHS